jgi:hypothetical protein
MQKIRILFYTDHEEIVDSKGEAVGLRNLTRFIEEKSKGLVELEITSINRHVSLVTKGLAQGANRLSWGMLSGFDELWIFGRRQVNIPNDKELPKAEPYNELDDHEVAVLEQWMNAGGGLMFTGDHSDLNPLKPRIDCSEPGHNSFLTLGRALGYRIPRAKQLRVWEGPPTFCIDEQLDNVNTQMEGKCSTSYDAPCLQYDEIPQTLLQSSAPHRLFVYANLKGDSVRIEVLPDHAHEGKVLVPEKLDESWPKASPLPVVAAKSADKRPGLRREYDLSIAYDGHPLEVGRIVADSSFHHFVDKNLMNIVGKDCCGVPLPETHLDQIAHYFMNLVLWLAPPLKRKEITSELAFRLAQHPDVLEARGGSVGDLGSAARSVASVEWSESNLYQLFGGSVAENSWAGFDNLMSMAFFQERIPAEAKGVQSEELLGSIIHGYHEFFRREGIHSPGFLDKDPTTPDVIATAITRAFGNQPLIANQLMASLRPQSTGQQTRKVKETMTMAFKCGTSTWKSWINPQQDPLFGDPPNDGFIDTDVVAASGNFLGLHRLQNGFIRPILGQCKDTPDHFIMIRRVDGPSDFHLYFGKITTVDGKEWVLRGDGVHRQSNVEIFLPTEAGLDFLQAKLASDEEWVAVKST